MAIAGIPTPETGMDAFLNQLKQGSENRLRAAQTKREEALASLPFGGASVPGAAGQVVGLEMIRKMYGEDSPQYQQAQQAFNLNQQGVKSRIDYQNMLTGTANKRASSPMAKSLQELDDIRNGYMPGTKTKLTPEQQQEYQDTYGLDLIKKTTDADTRKRNLFSSNIDITLNKIDPQALTQYSGIKGAAQLLKEKALDQAGKSSPEYKAYQNSLTNAKLLAKQVRQFYGDSITPSVQEGLKKLTDPATWLKSPEIAMQNFNAFVDTLKAESQTYRKATKSPAIYSGQSAEQPPQMQQAPPQPQMQQQAPQYTPQQLQSFAADTVRQLIAKGKSPQEAQQMVDAEMAKLMGGA